MMAFSAKPMLSINAAQPEALSKHGLIYLTLSSYS